MQTSPPSQKTGTRPITVLPFLLIILLFLYFANLVVYRAGVDIFSVTDQWQLLTIGIILALLSASFVAATILGTKSYNRFTRYYYLISAIWMGFWTYLFLSSILYGMILVFTQTTSQITSTIGEILFLIAFLASTYGVFHGRKLHIKNIKISISKLPEKWQGRKAIWMSDLHLGQIYGPRFIKRIVDMVNSAQPDIIFIGGDLYDGTRTASTGSLAEILKKLQPSLSTYFVTGNHEEFGDSAIFVSAVRSAGIETLIDKKIDIDGVQIIGVDYHNASNRSRFKKILSDMNIQEDKPSILLKHEPKDIDIAEEAGISLQISGHTHRAQLWPLEYVAKMVYRNHTYGHSILKRMQIFVSSGAGTWGPPMRVGTESEMILFTFENRE